MMEQRVNWRKGALLLGATLAFNVALFVLIHAFADSAPLANALSQHMVALQVTVFLLIMVPFGFSCRRPSALTHRPTSSKISPQGIDIWD